MAMDQLVATSTLGFSLTSSLRRGMSPPSLPMFYNSQNDYSRYGQDEPGIMSVNKMFSTIQYFNKGTVYHIRNRKTGMYLSAGDKLTTKPIQNSPHLLWMLSEVKNNQFQIIHMRTGAVLAYTDKEQVKLEKGRLKQNQLWGIDRAEVVEGTSFFWVRPRRTEQSCLHASAVTQGVKVSNLDCTLRVCLWQFIEYDGNLLEPLSVLRSQFSSMVVDVPEHSTKDGVSLIQYFYHGRGNQRWILQSISDSSKQMSKASEFFIRSYCSDLYLTSYFSKVSYRAMQCAHSGSIDQRWVIAPTQDNMYIIQAVSNTSYYLGVNGDKGGSYLTLTQDKQKAHWQIQGYCPSF